MIKRILSIALTMVLAVPTALVAVPPSAAAEGMPVYQASAAFVAEAGKYNQPPWQWEAYDTESSMYAPLLGGTNPTAFNNTSNGFPVPAGEENGAFGFKRAGNDNASTAIGKYWMTPDKNNAAAKKRYYAVRTFTVPETGNITISAAGITDADTGKILGQVKGTGKGGDVRLMLESRDANTQIWPESGWQNVPRSGNTSFSPLTINVKEGDKLHFEVADSTANGSTNWDQAVYWDPVVTYNSLVAIRDFQPSVTDNLPLSQVFTIITEDETEPVSASDVSISGTTEATVRDFSFTDGNTISFAFDGLAYSGTYEVEIRGLKPVGSSGAGESYRFTFTTITLKRYQASEYYDTSGKNNPMTVDGEAPWTWESYDLKTKSYTRLPGFNSTRGYAIVGGWNAVTAVDSSAMYGDTRQDGQGGFEADETYAYAWQRYYPVRTFTVTESGKVTLTAAGGIITAPSSAAPNLRILLERSGEFTQVWPNEGWEAVNASAPVRFTPVVQNVVEGDKLHFELSAEEAATGNCWSMIADWDPIVAYNELHPTVIEISPENGAADVPGNTEFVVTFAEEICEPSLQDAEIDGGAAVADVWLENENAVHILLDSTTLKEQTSYSIRLKNIRLKTIDEQNSFEQCITFTTAGYTVFGEFSRSGAAVTLPVNNTLGENNPVTVTVIVALCTGTPENYTIKSAEYKTKVITGNDNITVTLDAAPVSGEFVKAAAVTAPNFGKLLTDIAILK